MDGAQKLPYRHHVHAYAQGTACWGRHVPARQPQRLPRASAEASSASKPSPPSQTRSCKPCLRRRLLRVMPPRLTSTETPPKPTTTQKAARTYLYLWGYHVCRVSHHLRGYHVCRISRVYVSKHAKKQYNNGCTSAVAPSHLSSAEDKYTLTVVDRQPMYHSRRLGGERLLEFGTTCTAVLLQGRDVAVANVGDSSAVVGRCVEVNTHPSVWGVCHPHACRDDADMHTSVVAARTNCDV